MIGFIGTCTAMTMKRRSYGKQLPAYVALERLGVLSDISNIAEVVLKCVEVHGGVTVALTGMVIKPHIR